MLMFVIANRPTVGYCYYWKIGKKRVTVLLENRQDLQIGLLWDCVTIGIQWMLMFVIC